jgi:diguanylate cyclase (GGDEF)-like protein
MISLKRYLDGVEEEPAAGHTDPAELLEVGLKSYRSVLRSMGESGARACPGVGADLQQGLKNLSDRLDGAVTLDALAEASAQANEQLRLWGDRTSDYFKAKTAEVKELLIALAHTAEAVGQRDRQYGTHLNQFTARLKTISNLEDLTQVRASLVQHATELKSYVEKMEVDSNKLVQKLQTDVSAYETKLKKVEDLALRDALTGLANRHNVEERLQAWTARGQAFCVVMLDLNCLKKVNDKHGHQAGDDLLKQFAQELRSNSRSSDIVGRWGGDEFLVLMEGGAAAAFTQIERMKKWVFGEYTIRGGKDAAGVKVNADAALGLAQWQTGETIKAVIAQADAEMYKQKKEMARAQRA